MLGSARRIIAIDIENICRKPRPSEGDVLKAREAIEAIAEPRDRDAVIIGTSHSSNWLAAASAWPGALQAFQRGHNGADLAIISALSSYDYGTVSEVLFFGGDGIFAKTLKEIAQSGTLVHVFSHADCTSRSIYRAPGYTSNIKVTTLGA